MKKILAIFALVVMIFSMCQAAFAQSTPEAFMGFSVTEDWLVFSKDMTDEKLLETLDLTQKEVNKILDDADCEYFLSNTEKNQRVYLKIENNDLSKALYNISGTDDTFLKENAEKILNDCFSVDSFIYNQDDITFTSNSQMKLMTIKGTMEKEEMLIGITFVNGSGIAFMMHTDEITEETLKDFNEIANSVSFTVIREKDGEDEGTGTSQTAFKYIAGGLGVLFFGAVLIFLADRKKKTEKENVENETLSGQTGNDTPLE